MSFQSGSHGLVVMVGYSWSKDYVFESLHHILDSRVFTFLCCKNVLVENDQKEADDVQLFLFKFNSYALTIYRQFFHRDIFDTFFEARPF